jgi:hypothetical protein
MDFDKIKDSFKNKDFSKDKNFVKLKIWSTIVSIIKAELKNNPPCKGI